MEDIFILGGSYGGVSTAHRIFKTAGKQIDFKTTLVSPNSYFYWNSPAPRAIVLGEFTDEELFDLIAVQHGVDRFNSILGSPESLEVEAKTVAVVGQDQGFR
ncbi:hypothetical protein BCR34DRAFT_609071 [Clohesyomyces aquaticus]|uniref:FAD/NAD(P)-binding domain-containing protein n=1 Tax=Clohesyomyces aquaticus TaxID=1231657 RepID=A0A1Y1XZP0_9PLEO|nr:hypothetical protein BCR34DRAFT_609071 [Clohesyomyces aquaticus]